MPSRNRCKPKPDEEMVELRRLAKKVSRDTGLPVEALMRAIARLVVAEQLKTEASDEPDTETGAGH